MFEDVDQAGRRGGPPNPTPNYNHKQGISLHNPQEQEFGRISTGESNCISYLYKNAHMYMYRYMYMLL